MPKYSFIVAVYNTEKYIKKCLNSIVNQTYKDFEVIVIDDGSSDGSTKIIREYEKKYSFIKMYIQKNMGPSVARNNGIKYASGKFLIIVDSDDYVSENMLEIIDKNIDDNIDILRYQIQIDKDNEIMPIKEKGFSVTNGRNAFLTMSKYHFFDTLCGYVYNKEYLISNNFKFKENMYHEDFGLLPILIFSASRVISIEDFLYTYVQRDGSIMHSNSYEKTKRKVDDFFIHYKWLKQQISDEKYDKYDKSYFLSYISNCAIIKLRELTKEDRKKYYQIIKENNGINDIKDDSLIRKIKKILIKTNLNLYLKIVR